MSAENAALAMNEIIRRSQTSKRVTQQTSQNVTQQTSERATHETSQGVNQETSQSVTQQTTHQTISTENAPRTFDDIFNQPRPSIQTAQEVTPEESSVPSSIYIV
jgi:hypothetical protein